MKQENKREGGRTAGEGSASWFRRVVALALALGLLGLAPPALAAGEADLTAPAVRRVIPVGRAVGLKLFSDGVMVVGFSQIPAAGGRAVPARSCGLREGDVITHINAAEVDTIEEFQAQLAAIGGEKMSIRALRDGKALQFTAQAVKCSTDGRYKLGAWLRDSMAGIGTITWYDPDTGAFGALGHGVNDVDTARLLPLETGGVLTAHVTDVKKGEKGAPGELHGSFETDRDVGSLTANTDSGVFGTLTGADMAPGAPVEVASPDQVHPGKATLLTNIAGDAVERYEVEITRLFPQAQDGRDMMVKVTDPRLLSATGGIVQGMSGSPLLQDGRLVGAVTHVLVSAPEQGYGIFAERMLTVSESL